MKYDKDADHLRYRPWMDYTPVCGCEGCNRVRERRNYLWTLAVILAIFVISLGGLMCGIGNAVMRASQQAESVEAQP